MSTTTKLHTATVTIQYVEESRTRATWNRPDGLRRFVIGASKVPEGETLGETRLSFTTLDPWKASLCQQARDKHLTLFVKYQLTRFFDANLLHVEMVKDEPEPDGDPERDKAAMAALEHWQRGPKE